jgi:hypothetical protein
MYSYCRHPLRLVTRAVWVLLALALVIAGPIAAGRDVARTAGPAADPGPKETTNGRTAVRFDIGRPDETLFCGAFQGFGVEWDPFYWNPNNRRRGTDDAGWKLITERLKTLHVPIVRMMFQLSWCQRDPDLKQWDWDNPQVKSALRYLDFCQANDIHVILTDWGWSAGAGPGRLYEKPDDPRFAAGIAGYLRELMDRRKYTCIKYLVVGNEPDNELAKWHSHAAYVAMYRNVDRALRREGLRERVKLTGPDMAGQWEFMRKSIDAMKDVLDAYDFHRYASWEETANRGLPGTWESLWSHLDLWRGEVLRRDPAGARKPLLVTEMGSAGGSTDEQPKIDTFDYGLHMADYGTTLLTTRIQGGIAWTAHDIYYFDGNQFMRWGMWRYRDQQWRLRPWAQAYGLLIRHAPRGSTLAPVSGTPPKAPLLSSCRLAALVRPGGGWSIFLVNRAAHEIAAELALPEAPKAAFAIYRFDQQSLQRNPDRIDLPPVGSLPPAPRLEVVLPPNSFLVLVESGSRVTEPQSRR